MKLGELKCIEKVSQSNTTKGRKKYIYFYLCHKFCMDNSENQTRTECTFQLKGVDFVLTFCMYKNMQLAT